MFFFIFEMEKKMRQEHHDLNPVNSLITSTIRKNVYILRFQVKEKSDEENEMNARARLPRVELLHKSQINWTP